MKLAVFCGSTTGNEPAYLEAARALGEWIGENGHTLVYGGGNTGLMGTLAKAAHLAGGHVIGVLPENVEFIRSRPQPWCDEVLLAENMAARKQTMLDLADAFFALPGGVGTLDEITDAITLAHIGVFQKPSILVNTNGYYEPLRELIRRMIGADFFHMGKKPYILFSDDLREIGAFLENRNA